jgi:hypothetical protein
LKATVVVPASATPDEAAAIANAIEAIVLRSPERGAPEVASRSGWSAAARREALDDRV